MQANDGCRNAGVTTVIAAGWWRTIYNANATANICALDAHHS
jgi:hypothetical protein